MALVFVVDDDPVTAEGVAAAIASEGHQVRSFIHPEAALEAGRSEPPAAVITDFAMPGMNGLEFLVSLREISPDTTFVVVSGQATVEDAVALMKHGVIDVQVKPPRARALRRALALAISQNELAAENRRLKQALRGRRDLDRVIGQAPAFDACLRQIERVAPSIAPVLLLGETGTGKEVLAEALHQLSPRSEAPLVKVHCAAIPSSLLESELFGYTKGSFTGAFKDKPGLIEEADRGTLLLDEIGEIPLEMQVKLLRVLETGEVQRIGELRPRTVNFRLVAATNRELELEVREGRFRQDLFFRLNVVSIEIPPLRRRKDDIPLLARYFLAQECQRNHRDPLLGFTDEAVATLTRYSWPGNVRELENVVARAVALAEGEWLDTDDLPPGLESGSISVEGLVLPADITLADAERFLILRSLELASGNKKEAARRLGIGLATLYRKLSQYGTGLDAVDESEGEVR